MCGIIGLVYTPEKSCTQALIDGLTVLQHRGQDAAGIVTIKDHRLNLLKNLGTVADVFHQDNVVSLQGNVGIGHVRYPTAGGSCSAEAQPLYTNAPFGIALAHNGNLTNTDDLLRNMEQEHRHINTNSDSEILLNVFAEELQRRRMQELAADEILDAVRSVMRRCKGGYAVVMLINRLGLVAFRDPHGIRPLCFGTRQSATGTDYAVASESVAIDALDSQFKLARDVGAGEAIFISLKGELHMQQVHPHPVLNPCMFEYVYFARPDSVIDGVPVYEARVRMGEKLAQKILKLNPNHDIDIVMPIPETSRTSALQCAHVLNRPYREGFIKNRYIARTFIMPGQEMRRKTVRLKLNTIKSEFHGKNVLLIDDSIVRGTTSMELVQMAKEAGAKKVFFASAAPPVRYSNVYGIDIPTRTELIAHMRTEEEVRNVDHSPVLRFSPSRSFAVCRRRLRRLPRCWAPTWSFTTTWRRSRTPCARSTRRC
jgi:amidophosphoribosyltransferase